MLEMRYVAAGFEHHDLAAGTACSTCRAKPHGTRRSESPQMNSAGRSQAGQPAPEAALTERLVEIDLAQRAEERDPVGGHPHHAYELIARGDEPWVRHPARDGEHRLQTQHGHLAREAQRQAGELRAAARSPPE